METMTKNNWDMEVVSWENGLGDDGGVVDLGGQWLSVDQGGGVQDGGGMGDEGWGVSHGLGNDSNMVSVRLGDYVGGPDVAKTGVDDVAGKTSGSGAGDSHQGSEDSL